MLRSLQLLAHGLKESGTPILGDIYIISFEEL